MDNTICSTLFSCRLARVEKNLPHGFMYRVNNKLKHFIFKLVGNCFLKHVLTGT